MSRQKVVYTSKGKVYIIDGREVSRDEFIDSEKLEDILETGKTPGGTPSNGYPFYSYAAGVGHENREEASKICRKAGFPTEFNKDGDPLFTSQAHRKKYCKQFELYDRNAGYGDAAPTCKESTKKQKGRKTALPSAVVQGLKKGN